MQIHMQVTQRAIAKSGLMPAILLLVALLTGCARMHASTELTRAKDPAYSTLAFLHAAVFADALELRQRKLIEDAVVFELQRLGLSARSTIEVLPPTRDYTPDERVQALLAANIDAVIVISGESGISRTYVPITQTTTTTTGAVSVQGNTANYRTIERPPKPIIKAGTRSRSLG